MGMIDTAAIINSVDLIDLATQAGAELYRSNTSWRASCPLHGGDNETAFSIYLGKDGGQLWKCFSHCGGGDAIRFVELWQGLDFVEACQWIAGEHDIDPARAQALARERARKAELRLEQAIADAQVALDNLRSANRHMFYHNNLDTQSRQLWRAEGFRDDTIDWLRLGYCHDFTIHTKQGVWHTPTLTIPIFAPGRELVNIRHRLISPPSKNNKYRPEMAGLSSPPLLYDPEIGYDTDRIIWVEGEKKGGIVGQTLDTPGIQIAGLCGHYAWRDSISDAQNHTNYMIFDPGSEDIAYQFARECGGGRVVVVTDKIDDMILRHNLGKDWLQNVLRNARMVI